MAAILKPSDIDDIIARYSNGHTVRQLMRAFGIGDKRLRGILKAGGVYRPSGSVTRLDVDQIVAMYESGKSTISIASLLSCTDETVRYHLQCRGVTRRSGSESAGLMWSSLDHAGKADRCKNMKWSHSKKVASAKTAHRLKHKQARGEREIAYALAGAGYSVDLQTACGPYNIDVAIPGLTIAVEILGSGWHSRNKAEIFNRTKYLLDSGWAVLFVCTYKRGLGKGPAFSFKMPSIMSTAKHAVAALNILCGDPTSRGKYGMIGCCGEPISAPSGYLDGLPIIEALYSSRQIA